MESLLGMSTWYKLKKQAKLLLLFGAKNREAERELARFHSF